MQLIKSKLFLITLICSSLLANDESILSKDRLNIFDLSKEQTDENSAKLSKDWISPIMYTYSNNKGETYDTTKSFVSISQPIFRSGGIYAAIKYADALNKYTHLDISLQKKAMIKDATALLFGIHKAALSIKKQELLLKNAQIDIVRKKEQVLNGFLDTSFLDNAILEANIRKNSLVELEFNKEQLINSFSSLASGEYFTFTLPKLKFVEENNFIAQNLNIKKATQDIEYKYQFKNMAIARYLPTVNATYDYTRYHDTNNNPSLTLDSATNYGFNIQIPLDIRALNEMQSTKIDYMKSKISKSNIVLEENNFFKTKRARIIMLRKKANIAQSDYELYNSLLEVITQERDAGLKTKSDVDTLSNSQKVKALEIKIHELDEQIELLELYAKIG